MYSAIFARRKELAKHLDKHHAGSVPPNRIEIFLDLCERQIDLSDDQIEACLICGQELTLHELQGHIGGHMEDLALFVLPSTSEDEEVQGSKASVQVQVVKLHSQGGKSDEESSFLGDLFSDVHLSDGSFRDTAEPPYEEEEDSSQDRQASSSPTSEFLSGEILEPIPPDLLSITSVAENPSTEQLAEEYDIKNHWAFDIFSTITPNTWLPALTEK
ncbi:C2H2 type zinc finger domain protein [Penicillium herquei]|nr:C2H2 type zinc finger domain protein [Penicillium herquei]